MDEQIVTQPTIGILISNKQTDSCNRNLILKTILLRKISKAQRVFIVCSCLYEVLGKAELISNCIKQISGFFSTGMYLVHSKWGTGIWCECSDFHLDCDGWNVGEYTWSIWSNCTCSHCIILSVNDTLVKVELRKFSEITYKYNHCLICSSVEHLFKTCRLPFVSILSIIFCVTLLS